MDTRVKVDSNAADWSRALNRYIYQFGLNRRQALRQEAGRLGRRMITLTPPRTKAQGSKRVEKDIRHIIWGMDRVPKGNPIRELGGDAVVGLFKTKAGQLYGADKALVRPNATKADLAAHHEKNRDSRGRVTKARSRDRVIGRWKFIDMLVVPEETLEAYIKDKQAMVGQGRGGWAAGAAHFGARVESWVSRHQSAGRFEDGTASAAEYVLFENKSAWASGSESHRIAENALFARTGDLLKAVQTAEDKAQRDAFRAGRNLVNYVTT